MKFEKGHGKIGGRKAGTPNKTTIGIKNRIHDLVDKRFDRIIELLDKLDPKDEMTAYLKLLEYVLPKMREQKIDFSTLTEEEVDHLLEKALNKLD